MADNLDEEALDNPINSQSKSFSGEIISTNETDKGISNQETENMEVHKHPHHITHKKKWGEYLLEFIMLFLAVFLGFLAENLRERIVEHKIEKEYILSLVEDLKSDTLQSNEMLIFLDSRIAGVDSVITALSSPGIIGNSNNAYRLWSKNIGFPDFISNDRTIQQLKNSGGLRLIRNKAVSDRIMNYDKVIRDLNGLTTVMSGILGDQHIYSQLFDFINLDKNKNIPVPLTEQGRKLLNEAYANRKVWRYILLNLSNNLKLVNNESKSVLLFIQKEYQPE
ncbi:MAG: hypothetical protein Q8941_24185 [Bacteroidota bacterium]|nr:hypothetical protein [Bacteroidota bacterium]